MSVVAVPEFLVASLAVMLFAVKLHWVSALSFSADTSTLIGFLKAYSLPVMVLCFVVMAQMIRMTRAALINQLDSAYIEMATLKGSVVWLVQQRRQGQWDAAERAHLREVMRSASSVSPYLFVWAIPGSMLILPFMAWFLDLQRKRRERAARG